MFGRGGRLKFPAPEIVEVVAQEGHHVGMLVGGRHFRGAANLEEKADVREAEKDGAGGDEEFPAPHAEPHYQQH